MSGYQEIIEQFCILMDYEIEPEDVVDVWSLNDCCYEIEVAVTKDEAENEYYTYNYREDCIE